MRKRKLVFKKGQYKVEQYTDHKLLIWFVILVILGVVSFYFWALLVPMWRG